jgi:hypothetical protein
VRAEPLQNTLSVDLITNTERKRMFIAIAVREIREAPAEVQHWFAERLTSTESAEADLQSFTDTSDITRSASAEPIVPSMQNVLERATDLLLQHGEDALQEVLTRVGVSRVKECPEAKLSELLQQIATFVPEKTLQGGAHA